MNVPSNYFSDGVKSGASDELLAKARSQPRQMTEDEWRSLLKPNTFYVAREKGTERPFTSPLYDNHEKGIFHDQGLARKAESRRPYKSKTVRTKTDHQVEYIKNRKAENDYKAESTKDMLALDTQYW